MPAARQMDEPWIILPYFASNLQSARLDVGKKIKQQNERIIMESINKIELQGYVGTVRANTVGEKQVVNFSVATEFMYKGKDGAGVSETTWHNVVAWSSKEMPDLSGIVKGVPVHIVGRMRCNKYTNAEGTDKLFYEVAASQIRILTEA